MASRRSRAARPAQRSVGPVEVDRASAANPLPARALSAVGPIQAGIPLERTALEVEKASSRRKLARGDELVRHARRR